MITIEGSAVLRDGQQIAELEGGVVRSLSKLPPVIMGQVRKAAGADVTFEVIESKAPEAPPPEEPEAPEVEQAKPEPAEETDLTTIYGITVAADRKLIPMYPAMHEALGSRTPAFVAWAKTILSAEDFAREYAGKTLPTVEEVEFQFGKIARANAKHEKASESEHGGEPI
jgi:hypothetical protein